MTTKLHDEHRQNRTPLTQAQYAEIFALIDGGQTTHEAIAVRFDVPRQTIANAVYRRKRARARVAA